MIDHLLKIKDWILDSLFPIPAVPTNIRFNETLFCSRCRARLPENRKICHKDSKYLLAAATGYDDDRVRKIIWGLKYRNRSGFAVILGKIICEYIRRGKFQFNDFLIVPVPLSKERLLSRGFNQSELIASFVSKELNLPMEASALVRVKNCRPQAEMNEWSDRFENIRNSFSVPNNKIISGKDIILVDDVFTSGATLGEAVQTLKRYGAKKIIGLVVAKAG